SIPPASRGLTRATTFLRGLAELSIRLRVKAHSPRRGRYMRLISCAAIAAAMSITAAHAAPIPPDVEAMIREAAKGDDLKAVVKIAKTTNPNSAVEIDALVASLKADADRTREERLAHAGILDAWSGSGQL